MMEWYEIVIGLMLLAIAIAMALVSINDGDD